MFNRLYMACRFGAFYALCFSATSFDEARSDEAVTVSLSSGRVYSGRVDGKTDKEHLWLRQETDRIVLTTSIRWRDVVAAESQRKRMDLAEFRKAAVALASSAPVDLPRRDEHLQKEGKQAKTADNYARTLARVPRVTALEIEVTLANWDRDVEPDGYEIVVMPIDSQGRVVPVRGTLSSRLIGERVVDTDRGRAFAGMRRGNGFGNLERWSDRVELADFSPWGAAIRLPFRQVRPEVDVELSADGILNVRLGVFGQGGFEASVPVRIRHYSRVRDRLQLEEGLRFFRNELSHRPRH